MNTPSLIRIAGVCIAAAGALGSAWSQPTAASAPPPPADERRGPPPESIAACKSLKAEQACSFTSPKGAETGTCVQRDASQPLACRPFRK